MDKKDTAVDYYAPWQSKDIASDIMIKLSNRRFKSLQPDFCEDSCTDLTSEQKLWLAVLQQAFVDLKHHADKLLYAQAENFNRFDQGRKFINYNYYIFEIRTILHSLKSPWMREVSDIIEISHDRILKKAAQQIGSIPFDVFDDRNNFKGNGLTPKKPR